MISVKMCYVDISFYLIHGDSTSYETKDIIQDYINTFDETKRKESYMFSQDTLTSRKAIQ